MRSSAPFRWWIALLALAALPMRASQPDAVSAAPPQESAPLSKLDRAAATEIEAWFAERTTGLTEAEIARVAARMVSESRARGLDPRLVLAVIEVESGGYAFAMSEAGALGLMQLQPFTARALASQLGMRWVGPHTLLEPEANVKLGIAYLDALRSRFGSIESALVAYNWGPTRIADFMARGEKLPREYTERVEHAFGAPLGEGAERL
jgi:soluble lytic murein transglycosylase-like protein